MSLAFDAASNANTVGTSLTWSHTFTGWNGRLWVLAGSLLTDSVTGVTFNGVAMTKVGASQQNASNSAWVSLWYLDGPATGAHNIVVSASGSVTLDCGAISCTGAEQRGTVDATVTGTTQTLTLTSVADNCWTVIAQIHNAGSPTAGAGTTLRYSSVNGYFFGDSNGAIHPAGSTSLASVAGAVIAGVMASFAPARSQQMFAVF